MDTKTDLIDLGFYSLRWLKLQDAIRLSKRQVTQLEFERETIFFVSLKLLPHNLVSAGRLEQG